MPKAVTLNRFYLFIILALALLLLWNWQCRGKVSPQTVETVKHDTTIVTRTDTVEIEKPVPVSVRPGKPRIIRPTEIVLHPEPPYTGTGLESDYVPEIDTNAILADYWAIVDYDTVFRFAEADIRLQQSVSANRIQVQRLLPTFNIPHITTTVTQSEKKRNQVYLGIEGYGGPSDFLYGAGASLMLKTKRDKVYEIGPVLFKDKPVMYKAGVKFLISFRK